MVLKELAANVRWPMRVKEPTLRGAFRLPVGARGIAVLAAMPMLILGFTMWLSIRDGELGAAAVFGAISAAALGPLLYRATPYARDRHPA